MLLLTSSAEGPISVFWPSPSTMRSSSWETPVRDSPAEQDSDWNYKHTQERLLANLMHTYSDTRLRFTTYLFILLVLKGDLGRAWLPDSGAVVGSFLVSWRETQSTFTSLPQEVTRSRRSCSSAGWQRRMWYLTWYGLDGHPQEAFHLALLADDGHTVDQRYRVEQVAQVDEGPEQEVRRKKGEKKKRKKRWAQQKEKDRANGHVPHWIRVWLDWTTETQSCESNQTEAGTALAMAMAAFYYCCVWIFTPHWVCVRNMSGNTTLLILLMFYS